MLISPQQTVAEITRIIKSASAREANAVLNRRGQPLWYPESYDHWVRTEREFQEIANYIEHNPVKAGLASSPEAYRWSSAAAVAAPQ
jgi:REP element-mobilizing transposase RayT